ncbi:hypothetical protein BMT55_13970 [Listeria newyorkensis]|uniref:Uncharacterized protein n=1 Tax=Listeria newyorkensis TaxID=1497681 RepID=A0ABX4XL67_9LIST|nr:hypothetical protein [Listeria newyorkensis]KMT62524.1 hypothetical protein X559_1062 [Listeria newyorkensis]PNP88974.1 hypothetical protein BMT55_13970 [Listeria newyorkensis]
MSETSNRDLGEKGETYLDQSFYKEIVDLIQRAKQDEMLLQKLEKEKVPKGVALEIAIFLHGRLTKN